MNPYPSPLDQACLKLWVSLYGPESRLARYIKPAEPAIVSTVSTIPRASYPRRPRSPAAPMPYEAQYHGGDTAPRLISNRRPRAPVFDAEPADGESIWVRNRFSMRCLLEDAPLYFASIRALSVIARHHYSLFRNVGCVLVPQNDDRSRLAGSVRTQTDLPAFAAYISLGKYWAEDDDDDDWGWKGHEDERNKVATIHLYNRVQFGAGTYVPWGDVIYEWVKIAADTASGRAGGRAAYLGVSMSEPDAAKRVKVLAQPTVSHQRLKDGEYITHSRVGNPAWILEDFREWKQRYGHKYPDRNHHEWAGTILGLSISAMRAAEKGWQIHLTKDGIGMRLCIPDRSAKIFFADRDREDGRRLRPIFHTVREHERTRENGKTYTVPEHFRGARAFNWNGYDTLITVPDHHHRRLSDLTSDACDEITLPKHDRGLSFGQLGRRLRDYIRGAPLDV